MEIKSNNDCLDGIDNMIFDESLKCMVIDDLEHIRNHIVCQQADAVVKGEYIEDKIIILPVLSQIKYIIERFYSDDVEEKLIEQYIKLRQKILEWYEEINTKPEK